MYTKLKSDGKTDLRIRRTRKLLWEALLDLLETRPFDSLTVQEICDAAMVHRTTFYKHFEDKYHLLSFGLEETQEMVAGISYAERIFHPMKLMQSFQHTKVFRALSKASIMSSHLNEWMMKHGSESLRQELRRAENEGAKFEVPIDVIAAFYSGGISALYAWWVNDGMKASPEQIDHYLGLMINRNLFIPE